MAKVKEIHSIDSVMANWGGLVDGLSENWSIDMELDVLDKRTLLKSYLVSKYKKIKERINIR
ncbi:hypothetical protein J2Z53_000726 [Clostridium moniliforme]|uniref:Uncharacterized protein n=1 Tax=Clostridium moniliforme TaxID=39489 RepID=A0ABS4EYS8_9CLOT|nr:hypothetical protein [Clostridium moniliforme]MBP1889145.1 hypothetical protein [Clostridium moniliforme]